MIQRMALIKDHYIHYFRTKFNSFAVLNYDQLKDRKEWWAFKDVRQLAFKDVRQLKVDEQIQASG